MQDMQRPPPAHVLHTHARTHAGACADPAMHRSSRRRLRAGEGWAVGAEAPFRVSPGLGPVESDCAYRGLPLVLLTVGRGTQAPWLRPRSH